MEFEARSAIFDKISWKMGNFLGGFRVGPKNWILWIRPRRDQYLLVFERQPSSPLHFQMLFCLLNNCLFQSWTEKSQTWTHFRHRWRWNSTVVNINYISGAYGVLYQRQKWNEYARKSPGENVLQRANLSFIYLCSVVGRGCHLRSRGHFRFTSAHLRE